MNLLKKNVSDNFVEKVHEDEHSLIFALGHFYVYLSSNIKILISLVQTFDIEGNFGHLLIFTFHYLLIMNG